MKQIFYIFFAVFIFSGATFAQSTGKTIVEDLNTAKRGQGNVRILQDESINGLIATRLAIDSTATNATSSRAYTSFARIRGYKIQVFSGNNQVQSKNEGEVKRQQIRSTFPEMEATLIYDAPTWRLRVGNFLTRDEANHVLKEMKRKFPSFGKEMYVVEAVIKQPTF